MQDRGDQATHDDNQHSKQIQPQARNAQRSKKARPHLNTNGVDEKNQAKFLNKMQHVAAQGHPCLIDKMPDDNTAEQHASNAKTHATYFYVADP